MPEDGIGPLFNAPSEALTVSRAVDEARLEMVTALHLAMFGETFARPQSPADVWREMLDRIDRARRQFQR